MTKVILIVIWLFVSRFSFCRYKKEWFIKCEQDKLEVVKAERNIQKKEKSELKECHCDRISLSIGSRTLNLFKR